MSGVMFRAKKKLASASMNTQAGRSAVIAFVGEEGGRVLDALKSAITKDTSAKEAKDKKKDILKLALKFKMMADKKQLTSENTKHLQTPLNNLCIEVIDFLSPPPRPLTDDEKKKMTASLSLSFASVCRLVEALVKPTLKPTNFAKIGALFSYFGSPPLLTKLRDSPAFVEEKKVICEALDSMLLSAGIMHTPLEQVKLCHVAGCDKPASPFWTDGRLRFPGSDMCDQHHFLKYDPLIRDPDFTQWLESDDLRNILRPWLAAQGEEKTLQFIVAVDQYSVLTNPSVRRTRAGVIWSKYIESKELKFDEAVVKQVSEAVNSPASQAIPKLAFQPARDQHYKRLNAIFHDRFIHTLAYQEWEGTVSLPDHITNDLRRKYQEMIARSDAERKGGERKVERKVDTTPTSTGLAAAIAGASSAAPSTAPATAAAAGATTPAAAGAAATPPPPFPAHLLAESKEKK